MHTELIVVNKTAILRIIEHLDKIIAVGTTSVRTLESLYYIGCLIEENPNINIVDLKVTQWMPYEKENSIDAKKALNNIVFYLDKNKRKNIEVSTQIMIAPGYTFKIVSGIVTNFHQPKSTLLLLISAFIGEKWKDVYNYALNNNFRFLSYGDSSLLLK
jgi:S-adenosylmethionine:tRNA ribosyltransferase-isomerase